jgi:hypothetical protein
VRLGRRTDVFMIRNYTQCSIFERTVCSACYVDLRFISDRKERGAEIKSLSSCILISDHSLLFFLECRKPPIPLIRATLILNINHMSLFVNIHSRLLRALLPRVTRVKNLTHFL